MVEPIQSILDHLEPHKEILRELVDSGGIVSFRVGWFLDGHTGETFHPHLMEKMADLGISVEFFVYVPDVVPLQAVER